MKRSFSVFSAIVAVVLLATCFFGCKPADSSHGGAENEKGFIRHTELQSAFLSSDKSYLMRFNADGKSEKSIPLPLELDVKDKKSGYSIVIKQKDGKISLTEKLGDDDIFKYYNSEIGKNYVWYLIDDNGEIVGEEKEFETSARAPRNLYVDGVTNCRDLGGWKTVDGRKVKQGMLYRTARFNENETDTPLVTKAGIKTLTEELGIKTELDLRRTDNNETGGITVSPLGDTLQYISVPMMTGGDYLIINKDNLADVFKVFESADNYPIAFHCSIGTDRTGVIAFLINAMLGVEKTGLYYDYLFSGYGNIGGTRSFTTIDKYLKEIKKAGGDTIAENAYNYLVNCGVPGATLDMMRDMLVE